MKGPQRPGCLAGSGGELRRGDRTAVHEAGDQTVVVACGDLGGNAQPGRSVIGDPLGLATDSEQRGVLTG